MDDLSICKKIAELEGVQHQIQCEDMPHAYIYSEELNMEYNPLTDDDLCFQLMVKYKVWRWSNPAPGKFNAVINGVQGWVSGETLNKAILLAIIEAHKE